MIIVFIALSAVIWSFIQNATCLFLILPLWALYGYIIYNKFILKNDKPYTTFFTYLNGLFCIAMFAFILVGIFNNKNSLGILIAVLPIFIPLIILIKNVIFGKPAGSSFRPGTIVMKNYYCPYCKSIVNETDTYCASCGKKLTKKEATVMPDYFDEKYYKTENELLNDTINEIIVKNKIDKNIMTKDLFKRKTILFIILAVLLFVYITMIFFHFPIYTYIIGLILLLILSIYTFKLTFIKALSKEIKARPDEDIETIILSSTQNTVKFNYIFVIIGLIVAVIIPIIIFWNPIILYEKMDNGYGVRFYTFGASNFTSASIPSTYKGENVISLRGNTFSNMFFLQEVTLPDTITEIRGQAFLNCFMLKKVNIPSNLVYLGGGAFRNAKSITSITLPDTLTFMGGEVFYGATNLQSIVLSQNLTEIRGDSFYNCISLKEIDIPDNITRIGAHSFYGNSSLEKVNINKTSKLEEIGSSAFRNCSSLKSIILPQNTYVNSRAFKNSNTRIYRYGIDDIYTTTTTTTTRLRTTTKEVIYD